MVCVAVPNTIRLEYVVVRTLVWWCRNDAVEKHLIEQYEIGIPVRAVEKRMVSMVRLFLVIFFFNFSVAICLLAPSRGHSSVVVI
jgi:NADH:ubiquinone oxidoreductase subunit 3 (subunit A)